jgi:glycosyltransferase involved in cell wall biosynthesis
MSGASGSLKRSGRPLFTIAIPTFNRAGWLKPCVDSALSQTFGSFEVIVSDNASGDDTADVLAQMSDERLVVLRQRCNIGANANWNACVAAATGQYFIMLCDDDRLQSHFLERCRSLITDDDGIPVVVGLGDSLDVQSQSMQPAVTSRVLRSGIHQGTDILCEFLRGNISPQLCTIAVETETLQARGGFPSGWPHVGDLATWVPLLLQGRAGFVNESCGTQTSHWEAQTSRLSLRERLEDIDRFARVLVQEAEQRIRDPRILDEIKKLAREYVARNFAGHMAGDRRCGASRRELASVAWPWRRRLLGIGIRNLGAVVRPVAFFLLPVRVTEALSRVKKTVRKSLSRNRRQYLPPRPSRL